MVSQGSIGSTQRIGSSWTATASLVALLVLTGTGAAAAELTPTEAVKSTIAEVVHILDNAELNQPDRAAERRQRIEQVVRDRVSYEEMAKRALGVPWTELTDSERQEFVGLFVQLLRDHVRRQDRRLYGRASVLSVRTTRRPVCRSKNEVLTKRRTRSLISDWRTGWAIGLCTM